MKSASVIIAFYNKIDYLKLVLAGFRRQTVQDFEIIIADDGSSPDVVNELETLLNAQPFDTVHLWQEDKGFRKNRMLNKAILSAQSDYLLFIDGDCVPHSAFVEEHIKYKKENVCLTGRRVNLSEKITSQLTEKNVEKGFLENNFSKIIFDGLFGKSFDVEKGLYVTSYFMRNYFNKKKRGILGCNFSLHKNAMLAIHGFDERYEAPSIGEDSDIQFRLELLDYDIKSLNNIAVQYHLHHKLQPRPQENLDLFEKVKNERKAKTEFGIRNNEQ